MSRSPSRGRRAATAPDLPAALQQVMALQRAGRVRDAEIRCRRLLKQVPAHPDVLQLLGILSHQQGRTAQALSCFEQALAQAPGDPAANVNLANLYNQLGRLDEAIVHYRAALTAWPQDAELLNNLGYALHKRGDSRAALEHYAQVLAANRRLPRTLKNAGDALLALDDPAAAGDRYREAVGLDDGYGDAWAGLGNACFARGAWRDALAAYACARSRGANSAALANAVGNAHLELGDPASAVTAYEQALALDPAHAGALVNLARCHEQANRVAEAMACVERALELDPGEVRARGLQAALLRRGGEPQRALQVLRQIDLDAADAETAGAVHFELARVREQLGDYDAAFEHFVRANAEDAQTPAWRAASAARYLQTLAALQRYASARGTDVPGAAAAATADAIADPVFVVGFPRSGTTLVERILDSHPATCVLDERPLLQGVRDALGADYPQALATLSPQRVVALRTDYFAAAARYGYTGQMLVDKNPLHMAHVPLIRRLFPGARFVLVLRHPCDACLSCFMQPFRANDAMANFLTLTGAVELYARVFDLWAACEPSLGTAVHTLRYEDLVADFSVHTRKLLRFLGLEWHDNLLEYHRHAAGRDWISTPSYHQVTQPIYTGAVARWRHYQAQFGDLPERLSPYAQRHGYDPLTGET